MRIQKTEPVGQCRITKLRITKCRPQFMRELMEAPQKIGTELSNKRVRSVANIIRLYSIFMCKMRGSHLGSCLSLAEIIATMYTEKLIKYSLLNGRLTDPNFSELLFISGGHTVPAFYTMYHLLGLVGRETLTKIRLRGGLPGHPESRMTPNLFFMSSGSLGQGLSEAAGAAVVQRDKKVFVIIGDGELQEGNVQEAIQYVGRSGIDNLIAVVDHNKIQLSGPVRDQGMTADSIEANFSSNGWTIIKIDGHNPSEIRGGLKQARKNKGRPVVIIADTIMGKGISFAEEESQRGKSTFHSGRGALTDEVMEKAVKELLREIRKDLEALAPGSFEVFSRERLRIEDFGQPLIGVRESAGESTHEAFIRQLAEYVERGKLAVAYLIGDLTTSSVEGKRVKAAIEKKKERAPEYSGFFLDVGIREELAMTMLKGIARVAETRNSLGETVSQALLPVFSGYAAMMNIALEPVRMALQDRLRFIVNAAQFGFLSEMGGNSHNTSLMAIGNFMPVFFPASSYEVGRILTESAERIARGGEGGCCLATSRFRLSEAFVDRETIEATNRQIMSAWETGCAYDQGAFIVGDDYSEDILAGTIVASGPIIYFANKARFELTKLGLRMRLIEVLKFGREQSFTLGQHLATLLPRRGPIFSIWDGDRNVLFERVATALTLAVENSNQLIALGPTEESDANGPISEIIENLELGPRAIVNSIVSQLKKGKKV